MQLGVVCGKCNLGLCVRLQHVVLGLGFGVCGLCRVVCGLRFAVYGGLCFGVEGLRLVVWCLGFRVCGLWFGDGQFTGENGATSQQKVGGGGPYRMRS